MRNYKERMGHEQIWGSEPWKACSVLEFRLISNLGSENSFRAKNIFQKEKNL